MAYRVLKVNYCKLNVSSRAGTAEKILDAICDAGVNMQAFTGFPVGGGKAQVDLVSNNMAGIRRVAKQNGWRLSSTKRGFLVQGNDEVGAIHKIFKKLADKSINVIAADAVAAGKGRYGMIMWVNPKVYAKAARVLNAK